MSLVRSRQATRMNTNTSSRFVTNLLIGGEDLGGH